MLRSLCCISNFPLGTLHQRTYEGSSLCITLSVNSVCMLLCVSLLLFSICSFLFVFFFPLSPFSFLFSLSVCLSIYDCSYPSSLCLSICFLPHSVCLSLSLSIYSLLSVYCYVEFTVHFFRTPTPYSKQANRVEQSLAYTWIKSHLEEDIEICLPKQEVYDEYK